MRFPFLALSFALAACAAEPVLLPDASTPDAGPCGGACGAGTSCVSGACVVVDAGALDTGSPADATGDDRVALPDFGPRDTGIDVGPMDAGVVDAGSPRDVGTQDAGRCLLGPMAECDGRNVYLTTGESDGGAGQTFFCGACSGPGSVCAAGEVCVACRCGR